MYKDQSMNLNQKPKIKTVFLKVCVCARALEPIYYNLKL